MYEPGYVILDKENQSVFEYDESMDELIVLAHPERFEHIGSVEPEVEDDE